MSAFSLIPADVSISVVAGICAIALLSGVARGFSGFGSALIFMPLASSIAAPRLVAALLLVIDFVAAAPLLPNAWKHADRKATAVMVAGADAAIDDERKIARHRLECRQLKHRLGAGRLFLGVGNTVEDHLERHQRAVGAERLQRARMQLAEIPQDVLRADLDGAGTPRMQPVRAT